MSALKRSTPVISYNLTNLCKIGCKLVFCNRKSPGLSIDTEIGDLE